MNRLNSSEVANLWTTYITNSASSCFIRYFLATVEDQEIQTVLESAFAKAQTMLQGVTNFFSKEGYPIPHGFSEEDVDLNAPLLYSDTFVINNYQVLSKYALVVYSIAFTTATRTDVRKFFVECLSLTTELFDKITDLMVKKGLHTPPPTISIPEKVEFIHKQGFLTGWFGERRPLNVIEIDSIIFSLKGLTVVKAQLMGFSQVATSKEVRQYSVRGRGLAEERINLLQSLLSENNLSTLPTLDSEVTDLTLPVFSDKIIMFHILDLAKAALGRYGSAMASSGRRDIGVHFTRFIAETMAYIEDGTNICIDNGWMEQPPLVDDRDKLARI